MRFQQQSLPHKATRADLVDRKCESKGAVRREKSKSHETVSLTVKPDLSSGGPLRFTLTSEENDMVLGGIQTVTSHLRGDRSV